MILRIPVVALLVFAAFFVKGQDLPASYEKVLHLEYTPSETRIMRTSDAYAQTFYWFLSAVLYGDETAYDHFYDSFDQTTALVRSNPDSPENRYFLTEITIQSGFLKLKFGHELSAAWTMRSAFKMARENFATNPDYIPFRKSWGVMQVLVGAIPDNYQWIPEMFGVHGSITSGISMLEEIPEGHWLYRESRMIIQLTRSYLLDQSVQAVQEFTRLVPSRESPLIDYLYMTLLLRAHDASVVLDHFKSRQNPLELSVYTAANAALQSADYNMAEALFYRFLESYPGQDFRKDAIYKTFLACFLAERPADATRYFAQISTTGTSDTEADRYAQKASSQPWPNRKIMQIRLATDGGFYALARKISSENQQFEHQDEKTEFVYRKARLEHLSGNTEIAAAGYREVILLQGDERWYFAPNACLQLGYILLDAGDTGEAEKYFNKVFEYRGYEYQRGIERKAHSALATHFNGS